MYVNKESFCFEFGLKKNIKKKEYHLLKVKE